MLLVIPVYRTMTVPPRMEQPASVYPSHLILLLKSVPPRYREPEEFVIVLLCAIVGLPVLMEPVSPPLLPPDLLLHWVDHYHQDQFHPLLLSVLLITTVLAIRCVNMILFTICPVVLVFL